LILALGCRNGESAAPRESSQLPRAVAVPPELKKVATLEVFARKLSKPVYLIHAPGDPPDRLFVVEQDGRIRILKNGVAAEKPFLDVTALVSRGHTEQGLLGLAFHPRFAENGRFFICYTDRKGKPTVTEFKVDKKTPDVVSGKSGKVLFALDHPYSNHNGGHLEFGPDGKLYVGTGDGGAANDPHGNGQNPKSLLAKMLRLDVDAGGPPAIVAVGLRNPWRYHFDRQTGDLYIADVGQNLWEWVHVVKNGTLDGKNFGWNIKEGDHCFQSRRCKEEGLHRPVVEYSHGEGCSMTGGMVYRGKKIPALQGHYFYADYCTGLLKGFTWKNGKVENHWDWKPVLDPDSKLAQVSSFGADGDGELYILSLGGTIYRLVPRP
jgi:glucose/arabinose dehydrogenase